MVVKMKGIIKNFFNKYKNLSLPVKAAMWFAFCSVVQKGISFITVPIFTRILTVEEYGIYSIYLSWQSIITIFCTLRFYSGCYINGLYKFKDDRNAFTSSVQSLATVLTIGVFIIYCLFQKEFNLWLGLSTTLMYLMFIYILFTPAVQFWMTEQRINYKYIKLIALTLIIAILNPLMGICGILFIKTNHVEVRVIGAIFVEVIVGIYIYIKNIYRGKKLYSKKYWTFAIKFDLPLSLHYLSLNILSQSDRIMINNYVGADKAAIYSLAYNASMVMQVIKESIRDAIVPWMYQQLENKEYLSLKKLINSVLVLISMFTFLFIAFAPEIIRIMGSSKYYEAIWIIPPVTTSVYFTFLYTIFSTIEFFYEKTKYAMYASVSSAILNVFLNLIFIKRFGYLAAGYTTLTCYIVLAIFHYFMAKRVLKSYYIKIDFNVIDTKFIILYSIFVIIFSSIFSLVYKSIVIRYSLIVILLIIAYLLRNKAINMFKTVRGNKC